MGTVLIIDDEPGIAELVTWCLDPLGVQVLLASGLESALEVAQNHDIGLVLLDFDLGGEDGLAILPELKADPRLAAVPFVAFTAYDARRQEAFERGVVSFIGRPFVSGELRTTVGLHLVR
ncbi:MAG TPA: response regulator [Acidimicrobiales bacterium]|nr:response regulator [Acidimicrobiales bacterium]